MPWTWDKHFLDDDDVIEITLTIRKEDIDTSGKLTNHEWNKFVENFEKKHDDDVYNELIYDAYEKIGDNFNEYIDEIEESEEKLKEAFKEKMDIVIAEIAKRRKKQDEGFKYERAEKVQEEEEDKRTYEERPKIKRKIKINE